MSKYASMQICKSAHAANLGYHHVSRFTPHVSRFTFHVLFSLLVGIFSLVHAQTPQSEREGEAPAELKADLPEVIRAQIIDTTQIVLEPRLRFNDPSEPRLIEAIGLYAKERLWNLPPIFTPQKAVGPEPPQPKDHFISLMAYPSLPKSLFYQLLFAGRFNETQGFLHLNRQQFGDERTKGRGDYNVDGFRGGLSYQYRGLSEIALDVGLNLKDLEWEREAPAEAMAGDSNLQKDLLLLGSNLNWKQQLSETTWSTLNFDAESLRLSHGKSNQSDRGTDLRLNFDMTGPWYSIYPVHAGGNVEYFSATDEQQNRDAWGSLFRLYVRNQYIPIGSQDKDLFVLSLGAEGVSSRERDDAGVDQTHLRLNPSIALTTNLSHQWTFQLEGERTTRRAKLSVLYFDTDYISLNPFLRPEKAWSGQILLKHHQGRKLEMNFSGFAKRIGALVVLDKVNPTDLAGAALTWEPKNIDASIYGGQLDVSASISDRFDVRFQYTHELHHPKEGEYIAYRARNLMDVEVAYHLPKDFRIELGGEFRGARHIDSMTDETLKSYFLLKPKLSKALGGYTDAFVGGTFAIGEYALLQGYELSKNNFDFGIELRF